MSEPLPGPVPHPTPALSKGSAIEIGLRWLAGQPFNNVMLFAIFAVLCYSGYWGLKEGLPAWLKAERDKQTDLIQAFDRAQDRDYETLRGVLRSHHGIDIAPRPPSPVPLGPQVTRQP